MTAGVSQGPEADSVQAASSGAVRWEFDGAIGQVVLNRPEKLNAINGDVLLGLRAAIALTERAEEVRVLVVRGEGRCFSAGADLEEVGPLVRDRARFDEYLDYWHESLALVQRCPVPVIAAVHGMALAGGFELTQVCDVVVMGEETRLADQHANFGLFPAGGSTQRLPRLVGRRLATWLLLSGDQVDPTRALQSGLVTDVVPEATVLARAQEMAGVLAARSRRASAAIKEAIEVGDGRTMAEALAAERPLALDHMGSSDVQLGLEAFRSRSRPDFSGK